MAKNIATAKTKALELPPFNEVAFQHPKYVNVTLEMLTDVHISCWGDEPRALNTFRPYTLLSTAG